MSEPEFVWVMPEPWVYLCNRCGALLRCSEERRDKSGDGLCPRCGHPCWLLEHCTWADASNPTDHRGCCFEKDGR